ncbi:MAG: SpoIIE family protein phosphatase [Bacteroidales bacterium]|nr:SpoIIE family protein phosphatase [Clostridium sp.]MCM1203335.1 SpoIIE family protein phosphatase [Bacteroidales bacterium]
MQYRTERVGIHILAFLVARCQISGMYPFVVPFLMSAYLQERSSVSVFAALLLGIASTLNGTALVRYAIILLFLLGLLGKTDRKDIFAGKYQIAMAAGVVTWAVSMPYQYLLTRQDSTVLYTLLEGVIAGCFVLVFEGGFEAMRVGTDRMFAVNERFIGIFALMVTMLFGCPAVESPINLLFLFCGYLLLYHTYRFDSSVGVAAGSITGLVLAFRMEAVSYLAVMILLASLLVILKELGKGGVLLSFLAGILLLGFLYEPGLLEREMLISTLLALAAFFFTPAGWLRRVNTIKEEVTRFSQDILIQEATRSRIENFGQAFLAMEKMLELHEEQRTTAIPSGLSNIYLSGDGISLLNAVEAQSNRLTELRKNFIRQLGQIGGIITSFQTELDEQSAKLELFEGRTKERLDRLGVTVTKAVLVKDKEERNQVYVSCFVRNAHVVTGKQMAEKISQILGKRMICVNRKEDVVGNTESRFYFVEEGRFMLTTGVVRRNRKGEALCGDNFSVTKLDTQKAVLMLSDGMGSGENAYMESEQIVDLLEQLLSAGFCRELAIELLNSFISFLADGSISSTLDLTMLDFYTGIADFIKLGASTTFIKRKERVECIRSTSLPVGVLEQVEFDSCARKLYHGDMIVMVSDGVVDGIIFEDKENYLAELIAAIDTNNAQIMAECIMQDIETMQRNGLRDDSTVLVAGVWER